MRGEDGRGMTRRRAGWARRCAAWAVLLVACGTEPDGSAPPAAEGTARAQPQRPAAPPAEPRPVRPSAQADAPASPLPDRIEDCVVPRPSDRVRLREAIVYARPGWALMLDLALPRAAGPHPLVLLFHGGGWSAGERVHLRDEMTTLAGLGYAAASVDYRLMDDGARNRFPTQIADARCAVRYLRRRSGALGLDPDRIAAVGFSAGGHLAELLATAPEVDALDGDCGDTETSPAVRAAIAYYAPSDLRPEASYGRAADRIITRFLDGTRREHPDRAALASPLTHVDADDAPVLLVHGTEDTVVPIDQSRRLSAALSTAGVPVRSVEIEGAPHGFRMFGRAPRTRAATCTSLAFLRATLR